MSFRGWDEFVQEARETVAKTHTDNPDLAGPESIRVPLGDDVFEVKRPNRGRLKKLNAAARMKDYDGMALALFGELCGRKLIERADAEDDFVGYRILDEYITEGLKAFKFMTDDEGKESSEPTESKSTGSGESSSDVTPIVSS